MEISGVSPRATDCGVQLPPSPTTTHSLTRFKTHCKRGACLVESTLAQASFGSAAVAANSPDTPSACVGAAETGGKGRRGGGRERERFANLSCSSESRPGGYGRCRRNLHEYREAFSGGFLSVAIISSAVSEKATQAKHSHSGEGPTNSTRKGQQNRRGSVLNRRAL